MPNNYDELPRVNFSVDLGNFMEAKAAAELLASMGMPEALQEFEADLAKAKAGSQKFIRKVGADEVEEAAKIERDLVGHSKSGYVPTGTLEGSITPEFSDDGMKVSVVPLATSAQAEAARRKLGQGKRKKPSRASGELHYYGVDVEFGRGRNPREPFMKPSGESIAAKADAEFEKTMRNALS